MVSRIHLAAHWTAQPYGEAPEPAGPLSLMVICSAQSVTIPQSLWDLRAPDAQNIVHTLSCVYISDVAHDVAPYFLTLANRNDPACVAPPKVAKTSKVKSCHLSLSLVVSLTNVANVIDPLLRVARSFQESFL